MANTDFTPTAEQDHALGLFLSGEHLAVEAGAGTGKTSTLVLMAEHARGRRGQYVAFNRSIVNEADRKLRSSGAQARTAHSLAARAMRGRPEGKALMARLDSKRQPSAKVAAQLGLEPVKIRIGEQASYLSPSYLASVVMKAMAAFCNSDATRPGTEHVAYIEGLDMPDAAGRRTYANNDLVREAVRPALGKAWADLSRPDGTLRFTHDCYLKLWELSGPRVAADYVMFDEAQDASPVMLSIVRQQAEHGTQLVYVGDTQQQIYGWRGAVNALASLADAERAFLTQSFRFGPAVAEQANYCLDKVQAELRVQGLPSIESVVRPCDNPRAVLCRGNAEAMGRLLAALEAKRHPHLVGGGIELLKFARAVDQLRAEGWTPHPELNCFTSWGQVQDYVEQDPQGSDLALMVKLVEKYGTDTIVAALDSQVPEEHADLVLSTAHKAKGREWTSVGLAGDFPEPENGELADEEWRLLYVAVTRAQHVLDIDGVAALDRSKPQPARVDVPNELDLAAAELAKEQAEVAAAESGLGYRRPQLG